MGRIGAKIEELKGAQKSRHNPKEDKVDDWYAKEVVHEIEQDGHSYNLQRGDVGEEKGEKPT